MSDPPWASMLLVGGAFLAVLAVGELLHLGRGVGPETTRRLVHVAAGAVALVMPLFFDAATPVLILAAVFLTFLTLTRLAGWLGSIHGIARLSGGAFLYPVAVAATFVVAHGDAARYAIAILALAVSDAASGLVGTRVGRRTYRVWGQAKSVEGSLMAFIVTAVMAVAVLVATGHAPVDAILAGAMTGLVVALVEGALPWGLDNGGIPLAAIAALSAAGSAVAAGGVLLGAAALLGLALLLPMHGRRAVDGRRAAAGGRAAGGRRSAAERRAARVTSSDAR
jgi:phytol kinase